MGIVQSQSFKNTIITYLGFGLGAINVLFLYTKFLSDEYHGLVAFVMSTANIMMPIFALGVHNAIIKFYSAFKTRKHSNSFLTLMLFMPLLAIIPVGLIGYVAYDAIANYLSEENPIIKDHVWMIFVAAVCFSYFEVFYSWAKVQMQSVFGNFMKEVFHRLGIFFLFFLIYFNWIAITQFIYGVLIVYVIRTVIMMLYAFNIRRPVIRFSRIPNVSHIVNYALLIIIAGSVASIILEIDKFMIGEYLEIEKVAYYGVAIYIAAVIGVPSRSMHQITNPITAALLNKKDKIGLEVLYKKSSINLFIISGLIFLLIILNIQQIYALIKPEFSTGLIVVLVVSIAKLSDNLIGNNNAILFNSDYYRAALGLGVVLAIMAVILNLFLIPLYGINGAAFATFISIFIYNALKWYYVYLKFKASPFTTNTLKTFFLILALAVIFYFWEFPFHPFLNIALKSTLIVAIYTGIVYWACLSEDICAVLDNWIQKLR